MLRLPRFKRLFSGLLTLLVIRTVALGADTFLDPKEAGPDFAVQG